MNKIFYNVHKKSLKDFAKSGIMDRKSGLTALLGSFCMKDLSLLVWLTQLGLSVAFPLAGCILLAVWLHNRHGWGLWVVWAGIALGLILAIDGFRQSLKSLERLTRNKKGKEPPPVSFNDHD